MNKINLTREEKIELELRHKRSRDVKERDRIKVILLSSEGWTTSMIAQALRLHQSTVISHIEDYKNGKLTISSGGSCSMLNDEQTKELISHLEINTYQNTIEIIAHIKRTYGINYSVPGINKWLHRNNFSYKKPKGYPHKAIKSEQEKFINYYNKLKNGIKSDENIMFMDSCHPSISTKITHGWIRAGKDKPVATTASRVRVNIAGAIELKNIKEAVIATYTTINGECISDFLKLIRNNSRSKGKIHLILDRAGYHRSLEVLNTAKKLNIKLHYLPAYSPNLNPIERLWKVMNEHARNNKFFESAEKFRQSIGNFFSITLSKIAHTLEHRINDNFQSLDYAF